METLNHIHPPLYQGGWASQKSLLHLAPKPWWYDFERFRLLKWLYKPISWLSKPIHSGFTPNGRHYFAHEKYDNNNTLCIGQSGSGKTTALMSNAIFRETKSSLVITGAKDLYLLTSGILKKRGYDIYVLDMTAKMSDSFNPLLYVKTKDDLAFVLSILLASSGVSGENSTFWKNYGKTLGKPLSSAVINQPEEKYRTIAQLRRLVLEYSFNPKAIDRFVAKYVDSDDFAEYRSFAKSAENVAKNTLSTLKSCLEIFSEPQVQRLTSTNSIPIHRLRKDKIAIYYIIPEGKMEKYAQLTSLFFEPIIQEILREEQADDTQHVSLICDELTNSGLTINTARFIELVTQMRKHNSSMLGCVQSHAQLKSLGQEGYETFMSGAMKHHVILPGMDISTAEYVEKRLGKCRRVFTDQVTGQTQETYRSVATASELLVYPENACILLSPSKKPALLQLHPFYNNKKLLKYSKLPPYEIHNPLFKKKPEFIAFKDYNTKNTSSSTNTPKNETDLDGINPS